MRPFFTVFLAFVAVFIALLVAPAPLAAQVLPEWNVIAAKQEQLGENHGLLTGAVEISQGDTMLYTDQLEILDEEHAVATGNVVLTQGNNRIAADRAVFNVKTKLGTFYNASGIANVKPPRQSGPVTGIVVPQLAGQETDVYFFGETVEKIGYKKYKITNGGFSSCVQPTPRWDLSAGTITLNVDHYTLLRNAVLNVKGVPMFYLPVMYYPTNDEERATGFLIPTYGMTTIRGQSISNGFFWAISRSQDATIMHDWYSQTGQGIGTEYRYNFGGGSSGSLAAYTLEDQLGTGPKSRNFTVNGGANQRLPGNFRAQAQVNYFSNILTNQTLNVDVTNASRNTSQYGGNVLGTVGGFSLSGTFQRTEWFNDRTNSSVNGTSPRIAVSKNERPLFTGSPVYFALGGEFVNLERQQKVDGEVTDNRGLTRLDFNPQLRYPFKRWPFLTVNSTLTWRDTYYTRSLDPTTGAVLEDNLNRRYYTVGTQIVGPVFTRVWDTPTNGYAEKFKHTIEPFLNIQRTSLIGNFDKIVQIDGTDIIFGGTTSFGYGINNRFYAKRKLGQVSQAQEIVNIELRQTYYTDAAAARYDPRYSTSTAAAGNTNFSPIALNVRVTPTTAVNATVSAEFDARYKELRTVSANSSYNWSNRLQTNVGWSHRFFIADLDGFNNPDALDHYINVATNAHTADNRFGGVYTFNYDVLRSALLQSRISAFYNAQCCGIAFEYQRYNFAGLPSYIAPSDHRFFLSFTLAGLGNFSPFNGAMGNVPR
jgi:LPS-assembly protein